MGTRKSGAVTTTSSSAQSRPLDDLPEGDVDEAYWARTEQAPAVLDDAPPPNDYDANFFADDPLPMVGGFDAAGGEDDDDGLEFADARETFSPPLEGAAAILPMNDALLAVGGSQESAFGTQALAMQSRRMRPEYVQYARVAKKVDVRRLKEEMWRGIGFDANDADDVR
ncbi:hypothetical protein LTS18_002306 [Coniosporium uncinatum]|uniref:Uncharacterized protein n=1 Tax=Coniosporium uncinatum TaxID=93489 RepID=A0ACC3DDU5_9PEZI|nr:hypothetical protein LTS18_002306 [Coniosporium uncinatum]